MFGWMQRKYLDGMRRELVKMEGVIRDAGTDANVIAGKAVEAALNSFHKAMQDSSDQGAMMNPVAVIGFKRGLQQAVDAAWKRNSPIQATGARLVVLWLEGQTNLKHGSADIRDHARRLMDELLKISMAADAGA